MKQLHLHVQIFVTEVENPDGFIIIFECFGAGLILLTMEFGQIDYLLSCMQLFSDHHMCVNFWVKGKLLACLKFFLCICRYVHQQELAKQI